MISCGFARGLLCIAAAAMMASLRLYAEETHENSRYQIIIERNPFGAIAGANSAATQPNFATRFVLVGLVDSNSPEQRLQAIITDKEKNSTFFKSEGESIEDIKVLHIEPKPAKAVIQKGLETATLTYAERPNASGSMPATVPQVSPSPPGFAPPVPSRVGRIPFRRGN